MNRSSHILVPFALALTSFLAPLLTAGAASAHPPVTREQISFPVTLSDGSTYSLAGHLYKRQGSHKRTIQVLVHGATYDHRYWDADECDGQSYSYARHMARQGYTVLALDQLGTGASDRPAGDVLTLDEAASSLHQVIDSLRAHHNPAHRRFRSVVVVGHSLGSITAVAAQAAYGDADALVVTGLALTPHAPPVDPSVLGPLLGTPYVTFPSSLRSQLFYHLPGADPAVVAYDNAALATSVPRGHFLTALVATSDPAALGTDRIAEPVFVQLGAHDVTAPASLAASEADYYPMSESLTIDTLSNDGHAFNLHVDNRTGWRHIDDWIEDTLCDH